jgi:maleate isomerase
MWEPDGWGWRAKIGVLIPHADVNPEGELRAMAPEGVAIHGTRVPFGAMRTGGQMDPTISLAPVKAFAEPPAIDEAAALLGEAPIDVITYAFTSSSYLATEDDDRKLAARLGERCNGQQVLITCVCALEAMRALDVRRLALIDPPWFDDELNALGKRYFEGAGLEVVLAASAGLPSAQRDIHPGAVYEWARANVPASADGVFFGGNGFRTAGLIRLLEADLGLPVLTANQVLLWNALEVVGVRMETSRYGRLFETRLEER